MTGAFSEVDPRRCAHYARFFKHLTLNQANAIFWGLFGFVLILMCISSFQHHKSAALGAKSQQLPAHIRNSEEHKIDVRRQRVRYLSVVSLCMVVSAFCTVLEVFAAFNIEYCDGEDLMKLYWAFWAALQIGSNVAILGVMVQFWIVLGDHETPSWGVALGTPVLVFAAFGFVLKAVWKQIWYQFRRGKKDGGAETTEGQDVDGAADDTDVEKYGSDRVDRQASQAPTLQGGDESDNEMRAPPPPRQNSNFWTRDLHYLVSSVVHEPHPHHNHHHPQVHPHSVPATPTRPAAGPVQPTR